MFLVYGRDAAVERWVASRIPFVGDAGFGPCRAIGVASRDGKELAGVVFHDYQPHFKTMSFSIAASSPAWARRGVIYELLSYPFLNVGIQKLWTATPHKAHVPLGLLKMLGFTQEAILSRQFGDNHAVINRMFRNEFLKQHHEPWLQRSARYGKANTSAAA